MDVMSSSEQDASSRRSSESSAEPAGAAGEGVEAAQSGPASADQTPTGEVRVPTETDMHVLGRRLAPILQPGDLLLLIGKLGAGKTTFVQGLGEGLGVDGPVTSPTFVLARVHTSGRVPLVHADAYRIDSIAEIDDLDLETPAEQSVTVVEWGEGMVEDLAEERLEIDIDPLDSGERIVRLTGIGRRWRWAFRRGF